MSCSFEVILSGLFVKLLPICGQILFVLCWWLKGGGNKLLKLFSKFLFQKVLNYVDG